MILKVQIPASNWSNGGCQAQRAGHVCLQLLKIQSKTFKYIVSTECWSLNGRTVNTIIAVQSNLQCILLICACRTEVTWLLEEIY